MYFITRKDSETGKKFQALNEKLIDSWSELFPIEYHPEWTKIVQKKDYYRLQLNLLITEYETLTKQNYEHKRSTNN